MEKRVTGIGGIFFKCQNPDQIKAWYKAHLGFDTDSYGTVFEFRQGADPDQKGFLQWSPFSQDTDYFKPSSRDFMINYRVKDLEKLLPQLRAEGVTICDEIETYDYGKFVHVLDCEGNKIELWEPNDEVFDTHVEGRTR